MPGENCSAGCRTKDHEDWGSCVRAKRYVTCYPEAKAYHKFNDGELNHFKKACDQGVLPNSTRRHDVDAALKISEATGRPYRGDEGVAPLATEPLPPAA